MREVTMSYRRQPGPNDNGAGVYECTAFDGDGDAVATGEGTTEPAALLDLVKQLALMVDLAAEYIAELGGDGDAFEAFADARRP